MTSPAPSSHRERAFDYSALILAVLALLTLMKFGMLPGLLAALGAYLVTGGLYKELKTRTSGGITKYSGVISASAVILAPLAVLAVAGVELSKAITEAAQNISGLKTHLLDVALNWRAKLPAGIADLLPANPAEMQALVSDSLQSQVSTIAGVGRSWAGGLMVVLMGLVFGALIAVAGDAPNDAPLTSAIRGRARLLTKTFRTIVLAQFWIATANAVLTAIFLFIAIPLISGQKIPYSAWLVLFTWCAGMLPIVGNLLCNGLLTLAGLGVSPAVGVMCLVFLIAIHKFEYVINAKVIGSSIKTSAWELLVAMFVFERLFGVIGLVAAPLYYAYLKSELAQLKWV